MIDSLSARSLPASLVLVLALALAGRGQAAGGRDVAIEKELCAAPYAGKTRPPVCRLAAIEPAGRDAEGHELFVATLARTAAADYKQPHAPCLPYEYDLAVIDQGRVLRTQPLTYVCNDGLASEGCGEGSIDVKIAPNRFEREYLAYYGCNVARSHEVLQLSPLKLLAEEASGEQTAQGTSEGSSFDWQTYTGRRERSREALLYDDEAQQKRMRARYGETAQLHAIWIPQLTLGDAYSAQGWRSLALGTCAAKIDGAGAGFLVAGAGADAATASFKVLATDQQELIVEVADDHFVSGAKSWLYDDHLELWLAPSFAWNMAFEEDAPEGVRVPTPRQWGIRVADGRVFSAFGDPRETLVVERQSGKSKEGAAVVRFRIVLPLDFGPSPLVTVVYSDSDDGRTQARLLATSDLEFGHAWTLGELDAPSSNRVRCEPKAGVLDFQDAQVFDRAKSAISQ